MAPSAPSRQTSAWPTANSSASVWNSPSGTPSRGYRMRAGPWPARAMRSMRRSSAPSFGAMTTMPGMARQ